MSEQVVELENVALPLPASPSDEVVLHGDMRSFLIYSTYHASDDSTTRSVLVECSGLALSRFGYPNDEGIGEHRLFSKGLSRLSGFGEVKDSELLREYQSMSQRSRERIWGSRGISAGPDSPGTKRHFIVSLKENVFEAICEELKLVDVFQNHSLALREAAMRLDLN